MADPAPYNKLMHRIGLWARRGGVSLAGAYAGWLLMMLLHETGHVLHGVLSGATGPQVELPLLGFSRTSFDVNPHPAFTSAGGPLWGALLSMAPLTAWVWLGPRSRRAALAFAGFCLIANGAYLGVGGLAPLGDAEDLIRQGVPRVALLAPGWLGVGVGSWLWHRAPARPGRTATPREEAPRAAAPGF